MSAGALKRWMNGVALATAAAIELMLGSACKDPDEPICGSDTFCTSAGVAFGAKVIPTPAPADTSARASVTFNVSTLAYTYTVQVAPAGTIDSLAFYETPPGYSLPTSATAILCAGAVACAATSGIATVVAPATGATIARSINGYHTQLVFFTTTAQKATGGAMRGTMFPRP